LRQVCLLGVGVERLGGCGNIVAVECGLGLSERFFPRLRLDRRHDRAHVFLLLPVAASAQDDYRNRQAKNKQLLAGASHTARVAKHFSRLVLKD
jgi:hypothetical protein